MSVIGASQAAGQSCSPHNEPSRQRHEFVDGWIKTYCTVCGGWIGNRPAKEPKRGKGKEVESGFDET